eukprot:3365596-Rhodomonas_salina.1
MALARSRRQREIKCEKHVLLVQIVLKRRLRCLISMVGADIAPTGAAPYAMSGTDIGAVKSRSATSGPDIGHVIPAALDTCYALSGADIATSIPLG